jgi:hypothetical protein
VIADPYVDRTVVESLLVRVPDLKEVVILASHTRSTRPPEPRWPAIARLMATVEAQIRRLCRIQAPTPLRPDPAIGLVEACEHYRERLPARVRVLNLESTTGQGQQFHDRYVLVDGDGGLEVWVLTNSLSMLARRFPLLITKVDHELARQVAAYLDSLERGTIQDRPELLATDLWVKPTPAGAPQAADAGGPLVVPGGDWQSEVLRLLIPDVETGSRLERALERGLLEREAVPGTTTWRVPDNQRGAVTHTISRRLQTGAGVAADLLPVLARWAYHGGPELDDYALGSWVVEPAAASVRRFLDRRLGLVPQDSLLPESIDPVRMSLSHQAPMDLLVGAAPEIDFHAQLLWRLGPARLIGLLDETRDRQLFNWLCANAHSLTPDQRQALLQSRLATVRALGILILWDRDSIRPGSGAAPLAQCLSDLATEMTLTGIPPLDIFLSLVSLGTAEAGTVSEFQTAASLVTRHHPGSLDSAARSRLTALLAKSHPLHTIVRVSALAGACPVADQAELDRWCFSELRKHLPLRGQPPPPKGGAAPKCGDRAVSEAVAHSLRRLHGPDAPAQVISQVIGALDFLGADAPLYPTRNFTAWNDHLDGLLWGLQFAACFWDSSPPAERGAAFQRLAPEVLQRLLKFRPGLWQRYPDFRNLLAELLDILARWMDDPAATVAHRATFTSLMNRPEVPGIVRLRAFLGSMTIVQQEQTTLPALAAALSSSPCMRVSICRDQMREVLARHLQRLRNEAPELADMIQRVEISLEDWWRVRYPMRS